MLPRLPVGERVRDRRRRLGRTQAVLAGLCGITTDYLSQIERGLKTPSGDVLARLAAELQVSVGTLLGDTEPERAPAAASGSSGVVQALLQRHRACHPLSSDELRARVEHAWKVRQTSPRRFTEAEALLPDLIRDVEGTVRALRTGNAATARREALRVAADLHGLLRSYYRRTRRPDLSLMAADRALSAAEDADDSLRVGAARWNLGHVLLAQPGSEQDAADVAMTPPTTASPWTALPGRHCGVHWSWSRSLRRHGPAARGRPGTASPPPRFRSPGRPARAMSTGLCSAPPT